MFKTGSESDSRGGSKRLVERNLDGKGMIGSLSDCLIVPKRVFRMVVVSIVAGRSVLIKDTSFSSLTRACIPAKVRRVPSLLLRLSPDP